jgi:hypothetical protein
MIRFILAGSLGILKSSGHPNEMRFRGTLVRLDEPSTKPPNGAEGHRIIVTTEAAKRRLSTLVGMGLNYSPAMDGHAQRRKVGVIQRAWIDGKDLCVEGVVWKHDFPEAERDLKQPGLGMSMELGSVDVVDTNASTWVLKDFYFLGATILYKKSAAYFNTRAIAAAKADERTNKMAEKKKTTVVLDSKKIVEIAAATATAKVGETLGPQISRVLKMQRQLTTLVADNTARLETLEAGAVTAVADPEDEDEDLDLTAGKDESACNDMKAKKSKKADDSEDDGGDDGDDDEEDDDDIDAVDGVNKGDLEDLGPETGDDNEDDDDPGHLNKGATNKGRKTEPEEKVGKTVSSALMAARYKQVVAMNKKLLAQVAELTTTQAKMSRKLKATHKQIAAASNDIGRRSLSAEITGLLAKGGISASELQESGQKLTPVEVDAILAATGLNLGPVDRMTAKNKLLEAGLMESGGVIRAAR